MNAKPDSNGKGRLYLYLGQQIITFGRTFYAIEKEGEVVLDGASGHFLLGRGAKATFRCVFGGSHIDLEVKRP